VRSVIGSALGLSLFASVALAQVHGWPPYYPQGTHVSSVSIPMAVTQEILYATSGRTVIETLWPEEGRATPVAQTEAQTHDASDTTYDLFGLEGESSEGYIALVWALSPSTYTKPVEKLRIRIRCNSDAGGGGDTVSIRPYYSGAARGDSAGVSSAVGWLEFDSTTKPAGGAWTMNDINAITDWGWQALVVSGTEFCNITEYEYEIQVWGRDP